jgi:sugar diacid utilization regulator
MDHVLLLTNRNKFSEPGKIDFFQALAYSLRDNLLTAGISRAFTGRASLRSAYEQTETALEFGARADPTNWYYKFDDCALDYMIHNCRGLYETEEICSTKLVTLKQYDGSKGTEYYKTLLTYAECQYNAAEAAKRLFINRSTLHYRLDRIQSLVKVDFASNDELLYLALSFRLLEQH